MYANAHGDMDCNKMIDVKTMNADMDCIFDHNIDSDVNGNMDGDLGGDVEGIPK